MAGLTKTIDTTSVPGYTIIKWVCTDSDTTGTDTWTVPNGVLTVEVLVVAGGGSGGSGYYSSGAGAGGLYVQTGRGVSGSITIQVGKGGSVPSTTTSVGNNGDDSKFGNIISKGGGYGASTGNRDGGDGGSSGGAVVDTGSQGTVLTGTADGATFHGYSGGDATHNNDYVGAGGGGAGSVGGDTSTDSGMQTVDGGVGYSSSITGESITYAKGGQGVQTTTSGTVGTDDLGEGGSGGGLHEYGKKGGSGVVIIKYASKSFKSGISMGSANMMVI